MTSRSKVQALYGLDASHTRSAMFLPSEFSQRDDSSEKRFFFGTFLSLSLCVPSLIFRGREPRRRCERYSLSLVILGPRCVGPPCRPRLPAGWLFRSNILFCSARRMESRPCPRSGHSTQLLLRRNGPRRRIHAPSILHRRLLLPPAKSATDQSDCSQPTSPLERSSTPPAEYNSIMILRHSDGNGAPLQPPPHQQWIKDYSYQLDAQSSRSEATLRNTNWKQQCQLKNYPPQGAEPPITFLPAHITATVGQTHIQRFLLRAIVRSDSFELPPLSYSVRRKKTFK